MWELEFRRTQDTADGARGEWFVWTRGSLEDCLAGVFEFKQGDFGEAYDAARLVTEKAR